MAGEHHDGALGAVYSAKSVEEIVKHYDRWSETYDTDMSAKGYRHPSICLALLARHLPRGAAPLLDAGAGTGLVGEWLHIIGYPSIEGLDLSEGMLAQAAKKNVYTRLHKLALGGPLPFADDYFAGVVSAGVFTTGHVGPEGLEELVRICRPGGAIVLTVKNTVWQDFTARVSGFVGRGLVETAEETQPYISMPGEAGTVPSRGLVLRVL